MRALATRAFDILEVRDLPEYLPWIYEGDWLSQVALSPNRAVALPQAIAGVALLLDLFHFQFLQVGLCGALARSGLVLLGNLKALPPRERAIFTQMYLERGRETRQQPD